MKMEKKIIYSLIFISILSSCLQSQNEGNKNNNNVDMTCKCDSLACCLDTSAMRDTILKIDSSEFKCKIFGIKNCASIPLFVPISKYKTLVYSYSELGGEGQKKAINLSDNFTSQYREIGPGSRVDVILGLDSSYDWIFLEVDLMRDTSNGSTFSIPLWIQYNR